MRSSVQAEEKDIFSWLFLLVDGGRLTVDGGRWTVDG
jgi:hypothetical protein